MRTSDLLRAAFRRRLTGCLMLNLGFEPPIRAIAAETAAGRRFWIACPRRFGPGGAPYNINADEMAGAVAAALRASCCLFLTDVSGVLGKGGELLPTLTVAQAHALIDDGTASGGMIPKLQNAIDAVQGGVGAAVVMDGRVPHCSLVHFFGEGAVGTAISA